MVKLEEGLVEAIADLRKTPDPAFRNPTSWPYVCMKKAVVKREEDLVKALIDPAENA